MAWNAKMESNRDVLVRIVALLFALADLADRAGARCYSVRREVLGILRPSVAVALRSIIGTAHDFGRPTPPPAYLTTCAPRFACDGDEPEDAARLAQCLRALGLALAYLLVQTECAAQQTANARVLKRSVPLLEFAQRLVPPALRPAFIDTS